MSETTVNEEIIEAAWNEACARRTPFNHGNVSTWNATSFRDFARLFANALGARLRALSEEAGR